jgi:hypothetical protein
MGKTKPTAVIVRRRYRVDQSACEDAIRRLLDYGKKKRDRRPDTDGPCDAKGNSNDGSRARTSISI